MVKTSKLDLITFFRRFLRISLCKINKSFQVNFSSKKRFFFRFFNLIRSQIKLNLRQFT